MRKIEKQIDKKKKHREKERNKKTELTIKIYTRLGSPISLLQIKISF
jgi:hypothetical protein